MPRDYGAVTGKDSVTSKNVSVWKTTSFPPIRSIFRVLLLRPMRLLSICGMFRFHSIFFKARHSAASLLISGGSCMESVTVSCLLPYFRILEKQIIQNPLAKLRVCPNRKCVRGGNVGSVSIRKRYIRVKPGKFQKIHLFPKKVREAGKVKKKSSGSVPARTRRTPAHIQTSGR